MHEVREGDLGLPSDNLWKVPNPGFEPATSRKIQRLIIIELLSEHHVIKNNLSQLMPSSG